MIIYTKNGVPINRIGDDLFDASGKQVAHLVDDRAFGPNGHYIATLVNDRLIYFSSESASADRTFRPNTMTGFVVTQVHGIATNGDEPEFDC